MSTRLPSNDDLSVASINRLKLAAATAIIRCKPAEMTAKEFAQSLGQTLRKKQADWKDRAEKLEAELLRTRQELTVAHLRVMSSDHEQEEYLEWDVEELDSMQGNPRTEPSAVGPELTYPTPPSSIPMEHPPCSNLENLLQSNTQFLHSMMRIRSLSDTMEHAGSLPVDTQHIIKDSSLRAMECLIHYISRHLRDASLPWKLMNDAVSGVARVLECCTVERIHQEIVRGTLGLAEELLQLVLQNQHLDDHLTQRQLCCLLVSLATPANLAPLILQRVLNHIQAVASMLRQSLRSTGFNPTLYENSFYLLAIMDDILLSLRTVPSVHNRGDKMQRASSEMMDILEGCLLHISDDFPLFCQQIWRIVSILEWIRPSKIEG
ncbi:meiosis-specific protein MEI4-like [Acanthaster planci]|uniref:Meiosis-specific protein MEI4-like n=1 Tax=Acanthaster planci TaxID=133434 RepID=A0A8B7Z515_ACAPL|nr:meiosis-specific protein MEI4-like [Acanthaster planci]